MMCVYVSVLSQKNGPLFIGAQYHSCLNKIIKNVSHLKMLFENKTFGEWFS